MRPASRQICPRRGWGCGNVSWSRLTCSGSRCWPSPCCASTTPLPYMREPSRISFSDRFDFNQRLLISIAREDGRRQLRTAPTAELSCRRYDIGRLEGQQASRESLTSLEKSDHFDGRRFVNPTGT